jgi:acyl carrier protein
MDNVHGRLAKCFRAALPRYSGEIEQAHPAASEDWDSLTTVTLLMVIQEEFNIRIPPRDLEQLSSFKTAELYLLEHRNTAAVKPEGQLGLK